MNMLYPHVLIVMKNFSELRIFSCRNQHFIIHRNLSGLFLDHVLFFQTLPKPRDKLYRFGVSTADFKIIAVFIL